MTPAPVVECRAPMTDLARYLRGLARPNPAPVAAPFVLSVLSPDPGQPWVRVDAFDEMPLARDAAAFPPPPPGGVVRIASATTGRVYWTGVGDGDRGLVEAPPLPSDAPAASWPEAWEGPAADAEWMLNQCQGVALPAVLRAACACAETALPCVPEGIRDRPADLLASAVAWARAGGWPDTLRALAAAQYVPAGVPARVHYAYMAAYAAADAGLRASSTHSSAASAAQEAASARAEVALEARAGEAGAPRAMGSVEEARLAARRAMAPLVRAWVPLGEVLRAHLAAERARALRWGPR